MLKIPSFYLCFLLILLFPLTTSALQEDLLEQKTEPSKVFLASNYLSSARIKIKDKNYASALVDLNKSIDLSPNVGNLITRSKIREEIFDDLQGALSDLSAVISAHRPALNTANLLKRRAILKEKISDMAGALSDRETANSMDKKKAEIIGYINESKLNYDKQDYAKSILNSSKAIEIDPSYNAGYDARADAKVMLGDFSGAADDYENSLIRGPFGHSFLFTANIIRMRERSGELDKAMFKFIQTVRFEEESHGVNSNQVLETRKSLYYFLQKSERRYKPEFRPIYLNNSEVLISLLEKLDKNSYLLSELLISKGFDNELKGNLSLAESLYLRAASIGNSFIPSNKLILDDAYYHLEKVYIEQNKGSEAARIRSARWKLRPESKPSTGIEYSEAISKSIKNIYFLDFRGSEYENNYLPGLRSLTSDKTVKAMKSRFESASRNFSHTKLDGKDLSLRNIKSIINNVHKTATNRDLIIISITTHGGQDGSLALFPKNESISSKQLIENLSEVKANVLIILDACYAGALNKAIDKFGKGNIAFIPIVDEKETGWGLGNYKESGISEIEKWSFSLEPDNELISAVLATIEGRFDGPENIKFTSANQFIRYITQYINDSRNQLRVLIKKYDSDYLKKSTISVRNARTNPDGKVSGNIESREFVDDAVLFVNE